MLMKAFESSKCFYCPLIWMFHSRNMEQRINSIHKRTLKLVYQDFHNLTFQELLAKDKWVSVEQKNLRLLATEIFKCKTGVPPELMNNIFHFVERPYNLRREYFFPCSEIMGSFTKLSKIFCFSQRMQNKN